MILSSVCCIILLCEYQVASKEIKNIKKKNETKEERAFNSLLCTVTFSWKLILAFSLEKRTFKVTVIVVVSSAWFLSSFSQLGFFCFINFMTQEPSSCFHFLSW